jgi:geranylgeranyl reductase family protein
MSARADVTNIADGADVADVAIVGAGPAGSWTACVLARRGAHVSLFDGSHPREKPCGGGVTGRALSLVSDALPCSALQSVPITSARFLDTARARQCAVSFGEGSSPALVVASRRIFDAWLLDAAREAGAEFIARRVVRVERAAAHFRVETESGVFRARWLVGADGASSLVRRTFASAFRRDQLSVAAGFYVHGHDATPSTEIALELLTDLPGYLWSFPRPDHVAVGICAPAESGVGAATLRARTEQWLRAHHLATTDRLEPYGWPIPTPSASDLALPPLGGPGWLLVGDAAGLVDPITREGIFFALQSATFAARAIASGDATQYAADVHRHILPELRRAARLKAGFFRPQFTRLVMDALERSAAIRTVMADLIAGVQPYRGLKRRLAATLEWRLAGRLALASLHGNNRS